MKGIDPIMHVLGILAEKMTISSRPWAICNFLIFLMLAFSQSVNSTEIEESEIGDVEQNVSSQQKTPPAPISTDGSSPAEKAPAEKAESLQTSAQDEERNNTSQTNQSIEQAESLQTNQSDDKQPSPSETLKPSEGMAPAGHQIKPSLPVLPASPPASTLTPSRVQAPARPQDTIPESIRTRFRGVRSYQTDSLSLPEPRPDISKTQINLDNELSSMKPPDSMFVPHIYDAQGRLLIRTLKNISPTTRTESRFYSAFSPIKQHRRIPSPNHRAWNQNLRLRTRPEGKPANGFVFISSVFGTRPNPFGRGTEFHNGIDLVGAKGIPILATAAGRVVARSRGRGYGIHVLLDHGSGYKTLYAHLSRKRVRPNQKVKRGQIIGYLGSTGRSTGPHLHYSVYHNRQAVDPKPYMFK